MFSEMWKLWTVAKSGTPNIVVVVGTYNMIVWQLRYVPAIIAALAVNETPQARRPPRPATPLN